MFISGSHWHNAKYNSIAQNNHIIGCEEAKIVYKESPHIVRRVKVSIWIFLEKATMNRDEGEYQLSYT